MALMPVAPIVLAAVVVQSIAFADVARGSSSQIDQQRTVVVRTIDEWRALWKTHAESTPPTMDFSRSMVVGVFLGTRPTAGFAVQITGVRKTATGAVVEYVERVPGPGGMVAQVLTSPFHLVAIPHTIQAVEFKLVKSGAARQHP